MKRPVKGARMWALQLLECNEGCVVRWDAGRDG
jgi:hypothetical protein